MEEARSIHEAIGNMTRTQERAAFHLFGFTVDDPSSDDPSSGDSSDEPVTSDESDIEPPISSHQLAECDITDIELINLVRQSSCNWFEVIDQLENSKIDLASVEKYEALLCHLTTKERDLVKQSHEAYVHVKETVMPAEEREAESWDGNVVSDSILKIPTTILELVVIGRNFKPL